MRSHAKVWVGLAVGVMSAGMASAHVPGQVGGNGMGQVQVGSNGVVQIPQQQQGPTGTVTGRVMCSDTQRPARFAQVTLRRIPTEGASGREALGVSGASVETGLDGTFEADGVAVGDYYVAANDTGYVAERQMVQAEVNAGMSVADILAKLPVVHVTADGVSSVTVTIDRGAVVAGQLQWEDGSPATGVVVTVVSTAGTQELPQALQGVPFYGTPSGFTDDKGRFRMTGLPAGEYLVRAMLRAPAATGLAGSNGGRVSFGSQIVMWSPGVFRRGEAKTITVKTGEERDDVRMVLNLGGLRTVSGHVSAVSGPGVTSGRVSLRDPNDTTINVGGGIAANGDFAIGYVPPGTYTLQVFAGGAGFGGRGGQNGGTPAVRYQPVTQTVVVGGTDVTGVGITLVPVQAGP